MSDPVYQSLGRMILLAGLALGAVGLLMMLGPRWLGRLPGDLSWERGGLRVFVPLGTCLLISLVLTLVFSLVSWLRR